MARILYISYDGMLEPLGQSQVVAYLEVLAGGHDVSLISFEKPQDLSDGAARAALARRMREAGIRWTPLRYHKSPSALATSWDIAAGTALAISLILSRNIEIVHARSYVAGMMAQAAKRVTRVRFIFDMRGFWADERVEGGIWPSDGRLYRAAKRIEHTLLLAADEIVTLTNASAAALREFPALRERDEAGALVPITVIPTCADLARFRPRPRPAGGPFVFGYVGSVGTWYMLDETVATFAAIAARRPDARFLVVNRGEHALIRESAERAGVADRLELVAARHAEVPELVGRMHAACAIYRAGFSRLATAPTKLGEYLGCGVPCLGSAGVGDMAEILEENSVGVALDDFGPGPLSTAVERLLTLADDPGTRARCAATAERIFSLERGVARYDAIYKGLSQASAE